MKYKPDIVFVRCMWSDRLQRRIKEAFIKLRNDIDLNDEEIKALTRMIDEFTTVSLHKNTVGADVANIVR